MLIGLLRRFVILVTALAFLGGATVQALPPSDLLATPAAGDTGATTNCDHMGTGDVGSTKQPMPCTGITPDCLKWMGCIGSPNLPSVAGQVPAPIEYDRIAYWATPSSGGSITAAPPLLPPIRT